MSPFDYTAVVGSGKVGPVNQVNHISWVAVVTQTNRPKSVHNCYVIELFCGFVCVVTLPFWHFCWCRGFCHRIESDLSLFLFIAFLSSTVLIVTFQLWHILSNLIYIGSSGGRVVKLFAWGARGQGFDSPPRHLVISCFQDAIWLKFR